MANAPGILWWSGENGTHIISGRPDRFEICMLRYHGRGDMTTEAKQDYISALHCMKRLPSQTSRRDFPGARSRFDDFAVAHLINTETVHRSPWLAIWHRHYVWTLEQTMREECGYQYGT